MANCGVPTGRNGPIERYPPAFAPKNFERPLKTFAWRVKVWPRVRC